MSKSIRMKNWVFIITGLIIIPIYSLVFIIKDDIFTFTLSIIGNIEGNRKILIMWGIHIALFFLIAIGYLITAYNITSKSTKWLLLISCIFLILTVITPLSPTHNIFSILGVILLLITMYIFIINLKNINQKIYKKAIIGMTSIVVVSAIVLFGLGLSGFFEILMVHSLCILLYCLNKWLMFLDE